MTENKKCCGGYCGLKHPPEVIEFEPLPDVSETTLLAMLAGVGGPQLQRSTQRLVSSLDDPNGVISAFSSFLAPA